MWNIILLWYKILYETNCLKNVKSKLLFWKRQIGNITSVFPIQIRVIKGEFKKTKTKSKIIYKISLCKIFLVHGLTPKSGNSELTIGPVYKNCSLNWPVKNVMYGNHNCLVRFWPVWQYFLHVSCMAILFTCKEWCLSDIIIHLNETIRILFCTVYYPLYNYSFLCWYFSSPMQLFLTVFILCLSTNLVFLYHVIL